MSAIVLIVSVLIFRRPLERFGDWFTAERGADRNGWL